MHSDGMNASRSRRVFLGLSAALAFLVVAALSGLYAVNRYTLRRADSLIRDVQKIDLNRSTAEDVQRILAQSGRVVNHSEAKLCSADDDEYSARVSNPMLNWLGERNSVLRPFGNRFWTVTAGVVVDHGRACAISVYIYAVRERETISGHVSYELDFSSPASTPDPYRVSIRKYKGDDWLTVELTTNATSLQRQNAFDVDLGCLQRFGGCLSACELLPFAWTDYQISAQQHGWPLPDDEQADDRCAKVAKSR
jgi:hypothetical protein